MAGIKILFAGVLVLALAGCATNPRVNSARVNVDLAEVEQWKLVGVDVSVPESLTVSSDPNIQKPATDIVWYGEPAGDRRAQVSAIVEDAVAAGGSILAGDKPVRLRVVVTQFHSLTPKARNGGLPTLHDVDFDIAVVDAGTGAVLARERAFTADIRGLTQQAARDAEAAGQTQKVRVTNRIAGTVRLWLVGEPGA